MRLASRLMGLLLLVALLGACDSTQPLQVGEQNVALNFQAVNAQARTFDIYDVFEDNNGDELPDNGQTHLWCQTATGPPQLPPPRVNPATVPWQYSVRVRVLRAGETVATTVTSAAALGSTFNVASYDTSPAFVGATGPKADICTVSGDQVACPAGSSPPSGGSRFRFVNPRRMSATNQVLMFATVPSPLFVQLRDDVTPPLTLGQGLCSLGNPGPPRIDGGPTPFMLTIEKGDTVMVEARMATSAPTGAGLSSLLVGGTPPSAISGSMTLDGRTINLVGSTSGTSVSFSYTSR